MTAATLLKTGTINGLMLFIFLFAFFLFGFSIQSGNLIIQSSKLNKGMIYSMILQGLQIVSFGIGNYCFDFYSGAKGFIGFEFRNCFKFDIGATFSGFNFTINSIDAGYFLKINVISIIILSILINIFNEIRKSNQISN